MKNNKKDNIDKAKNARLKLFYEQKGLTQDEFAKHIGASQQYISAVINGKRNVGPNIIKRIKVQFPDFDEYWFLTGNTPNEERTEPILRNDEKGVPFYDVDFIGGFDLIFNNESTTPLYYIDFPPFNDADCWISVSGKSMEPKITPGDILALKKIHDWKSYLVIDEIYAIVTAEQRTIKKVAPGKDDDHFTLIPINKDGYHEQSIPKHVIIEIYQVKGVIKKFF